MSNTRRPRRQAPKPRDLDLEELDQIGTAAALAALPIMLARAETPEEMDIATAQAWGVAARFILLRDGWLDEVESRLEPVQD